MQGSADSEEFRRIMGHYPTGVCVVTAVDEGCPVGMVVGSFTSVSLDPPLVAFLPDRKSRTWPKIAAAGQFCVNVLAEGQQDLCAKLSSKLESRFESVPHRVAPSGLPILDAVVAWVDCALEAVHEAGDHFIAVGRVRELAVERAVPPLVFHRGAFGVVAPCPPEAWIESSAA